MIHMKPEITHTTMITVDTDAGTFLVPADVFNPDNPLECTDGTELHGTEEITCWFTRLSAPGYLDPTEWMGPYDSEWKAKDDLRFTYDVCPECGDNLDAECGDLDDECGCDLDDDGAVCAEECGDLGELTDRPDYVGDVDYCHGGVWFNLADDWNYGYVSALEVCPIPERENSLWVSHYTTLTPEAETLEEALKDKHVADALRYCGMDSEDLADCVNWRLAIASMLFDFGRKDPDDYNPPTTVILDGSPTWNLSRTAGSMTT